jgi:hypothetical protein
MKNPNRLTRALAGIAVATIGVLSVVSCTPEQESLVRQHVVSKVGHARMVSSRSPKAPSDATLARLRNCESGGNYRAVSKSGRYRGAYQFSRSTWDATARKILPEYVGTDPAVAEPFVQDAMARKLWSETGWVSWPVCGRRA